MTTSLRRRTLLLATPAWWCALVRAQAIEAPNVVPIHDRLVTSGQPTEAALRGLGQLGFQAVVYLAPSTVPDAIPAEPELLAQQGIEFIHHPVPFAAPTEAHFQGISATLQRLQDRRVLVHCQVNMRASSMVFLHRVVTVGEKPELAWEAVSRVWTPQGPWKALITAQLARHRIPFDLL